MPTSVPGSSTQRPSRAAGFTLVEMMVVVAIIAFATVGVSFALRDSGAARLDREAERLAALFESARAQSRATGVPVRWVLTEQGFRFEGTAPNALPQKWLEPGIAARGSVPVVLGPEPVIGRQEVLLTSPSAPDRVVRLATDGLRPFVVAPVEPAN